LDERRDGVACLQPSPIHWDFHPANVLLRKDGSAVVIDWTQVGVSDARFDLAWTLLLAGSQGSMAWRDRILAEYERLVGARVEQLDYFEVVACLKRLGSVIISLTHGPEKLGMRPEAVAMMKQRLDAIRKVYELLVERTGLEVAEAEIWFRS
jgi:aminoglycoside phosphotransferase (APT) family kinase protein